MTDHKTVVVISTAALVLIGTLGFLGLSGWPSGNLDSVDRAGSSLERDQEGCFPLPSTAAATLRRPLPPGWRLVDGVFVNLQNRRREFDGAPVSVVAAWVVDSAGTPVTAVPTLWIWSGGISAEYQTFPKTYYFLNDAASEVLEAGYAVMDDAMAESFRPFPDARTLARPFSEDGREALQALACLEHADTSGGKQPAPGR